LTTLEAMCQNCFDSFAGSYIYAEATPQNAFAKARLVSTWMARPTCVT